MTNPDVIIVGSLHLDIVVQAGALPRLDETARGSSWKMVCGGKGGNQACWAAHFGAKTAMVGRVGADDFGNRLLANLVSRGVDTKAVGVDPSAGSGMSVAIVQDDGEYGAVIVSGSNLALSESDVQQSLRALGPSRVTVLQNEIEENINIAAATSARSLGGRVILNAAPARPIGEKLASLIDVLVVNRVEAHMMTGMPVDTQDDAEAALSVLRQSYPCVIITMGGAGLIVGSSREAPVFIAAEKVTVTSTHGAGDCFIGQLAALLAKNVDVVDACRAASRAAARLVSGMH